MTSTESPRSMVFADGMIVQAGTPEYCRQFADMFSQYTNDVTVVDGTLFTHVEE